jgi:hypothetical protein
VILITNTLDQKPILKFLSHWFRSPLSGSGHIQVIFFPHARAQEDFFVDVNG